MVLSQQMRAREKPQIPKTWEPDRRTQQRMEAAWHPTPDDVVYLRSCAQALRLAMRQPFAVPGQWAKVSQGYRQFVRFCGWLSVVESPQPIPLPRQKLAALFDVRLPITISVWIDWAAQEGLVRRVQVAGGRQPALYRFNIEQIPALRERV